jgi:hypothetical protein
MKLNKRGMATFATEETGELILSIFIVAVLIFIGAVIAFTFMRAGPDGICRFNVQATELFTWDAKLVETKTSLNFLCNQWKDQEVIDVNFVECGAFIDYDISECPYLNDVCDSVNVRDVSGGCIDQAMLSEGFTDKEEFILQYCEYAAFCNKYVDSEKYPEQARLVTQRYVAQQFGRYAERCIYMSNKNDKFVVPCFSISVEGWFHRVDKNMMNDILKYTESAYAESETASFDEKYYRFGTVDMEEDGRCKDVMGSYLLGPSGVAKSAYSIVHKYDMAEISLYNSQDIKMVWIPSELTLATGKEDHYLGIVSYVPECKVQVEEVLQMGDHFKDG